VKNLEEQITEDLDVDPKWHKHFTAKRGKLIGEISDENCNVKISFPKTAAPQVQIKGPRDAVEAAKRRILDFIHRLENQVTLQVAIPQQYHAAVIGKKGANSQRISDEFRVNIQFQPKGGEGKPEKAEKPEKPSQAGNDSSQHSQEDDATNTTGSSPSSPVNSPSKSSSSSGGAGSADIVLISGFKDDCERAKEALLALVPLKEDVPFPGKFHRDLLADKAKMLNDIQDEHKVSATLLYGVTFRNQI
jgi:hypothetical protein